jgi:hypothetical protein
LIDACREGHAEVVSVLLAKQGGCATVKELCGIAEERQRRQEARTEKLLARVAALEAHAQANATVDALQVRHLLCVLFCCFVIVPFCCCCRFVVVDL